MLNLRQRLLLPTVTGTLCGETFRFKTLMQPTQRLELLIGILVQLSVCAPPSHPALDIQPGTTSECLVLHGHPPGLMLQVKFLRLQAFAPEQEQPPDLSHHVSLCPAPSANKRNRNFLLCLSFSPCKSLLKSLAHQSTDYLLPGSITHHEMSACSSFALQKFSSSTDRPSCSGRAAWLALQKVTRGRLGHAFQ